MRSPTTKPASQLYRRIWDSVRRIPRGRVATYGQIAALSGIARQPRLVGYALHALPDGVRVPWHRVVNAKGQVSARSRSMSTGEECLQRRLLETEGVEFDAAGRLDLSRYSWKPRIRRTDR